MTIQRVPWAATMTTRHLRSPRVPRLSSADIEVPARHTTCASAMALTAVIAMTFATVAASAAKERHGIAFGALE